MLICDRIHTFIQNDHWFFICQQNIGLIGSVEQGIKLAWPKAKIIIMFFIIVLPSHTHAQFMLEQM